MEQLTNVKLQWNVIFFKRKTLQSYSQKNWSVFHEYFSRYSIEVLNLDMFKTKILYLEKYSWKTLQYWSFKFGHVFSRPSGTKHSFIRLIRLWWVEWDVESRAFLLKRGLGCSSCQGTFSISTISTVRIAIHQNRKINPKMFFFEEKHPTGDWSFYTPK